MRINVSRVAAIIMFFALSQLIHAEEPNTGYVISAEEFSVDGRSRKESILARIGEATGKTFSTREELESYVRDRAQRLENLRAFKKSSIAVEYPESGESRAGIPTQAILRVTIEDGSPFFPIPYAFYNSNEGVMVGMIANIPNISGTLQNAMIVGLYNAPPDANDKIQWADPNFMILGNWTGIPIGVFRLGVLASARRMSEETEDRGIIKLEYEELIFSGGLSLTYPITTAIDNTVQFRIGVSPSNDITEGADPDYLEYGPTDLFWSISNEVTYDAINWIGNFRSGCKANARLDYQVTYPTEASVTRDFRFQAAIAGFHPINGRFNPNFRVSAFAKSGNADLEAGSFTRGIRNSGMKGNEGVFINTGLQTKLFRVGQAEYHLIPTVDFAWAYTPDDDDYESDYGFTVGGEILAFFDSMKNLPVKLGFAYDLRPESRLNDGKRYEIDFNFSLTY